MNLKKKQREWMVKQIFGLRSEEKIEIRFNSLNYWIRKRMLENQENGWFTKYLT